MASVEVKIKKLDGELARYKEQMSKLRNGPGKVRSAPFRVRRRCAILCIICRMRFKNALCGR
jgi:hypothetical protein